MTALVAKVSINLCWSETIYEYETLLLSMKLYYSTTIATLNWFFSLTLKLHFQVGRGYKPYPIIKNKI
jgi:hypothetical protein